MVSLLLGVTPWWSMTWKRKQNKEQNKPVSMNTTEAKGKNVPKTRPENASLHCIL